MQQLQCSTLQHATVSPVCARRPWLTRLWAADGYQYTLPAIAGTAVSSPHSKEVQR
jgi:hypothetical protein